jgi:hypothetical protein
VRLGIWEKKGKWGGAVQRKGESEGEKEENDLKRVT